VGVLTPGIHEKFKVKNVLASGKKIIIFASKE
jgi:hypothetical protein